MAEPIDDKIARWIRPEIRALDAYHVPDSGGLIKLDAMENPYSWPDRLMNEWLRRLGSVTVNRYPDPTARDLGVRLRTAMQVPQNAGIVLGNGSDELIQMILLAIAGRDRVVLAPEPTFAMYRMIATFTGMPYVGIPLRDDFTLDLDSMLDAVHRHRPAAVFLAYPNNPTGNLFEEQAVEAILDASPGLVVVDEAYAPFAGETFMGRVGRRDNLLVMRTVSKLGLAGLRLGLLAGPAAWLDEIDKVRLPYNINVLTQVSAELALAHLDVFIQQTERIRSDRERLWAALNAMPTVTAFPSQANFILFRTEANCAGTVFDRLRAAGILVKNLHSPGPLRDCLRVTVGTPQENEAFLTALTDALRVRSG